MIEVYCNVCHKKQEIVRDRKTGITLCKGCNSPINEPNPSTEH